MTIQKPYLLEVLLWVRPGMEETFQQYEHEAAVAMQRYGGEILEVGEGRDGASERHLVSFPDEAAFAAYRDSAEASANAPLRAKCIARTELVPA